MKKIFFVTILILGGLSFIMSAQNNEINKLYQEAIDAYKTKNYKVFLEKNKEMYAMNPKHPTVLYNLACSYSLNEMKNEAIKILEELVKISPNPDVINDKDFNFIKDSKDFQIICEKIKEATSIISNSEVAFTLPERDLHAESIAYDEKTGKFFVSSIHKRKILSIDKSGKIEDFIKQGEIAELDGVLGIKIDSVERILYASSSAYDNVIDYKPEDKGRTGVFLFDLDSGKLIKKYMFRDKDFGIDDVLVHSIGDIYLSNTKDIRIIKKGNDKVELFVENEQFASLQGIDFTPDEQKMFIADYRNGLFLIDLKSKAMVKIKHPENLKVHGIDGLYFYTGSLIAIQNGLKPSQVTQFYLNKDFTKILSSRIIERANPYFNDPTLGVIVGHEFYYVANDQRRTAYDKDFNTLPYDNLQDVTILKTEILEDNVKKFENYTDIRNEALQLLKENKIAEAIYLFEETYDDFPEAEEKYDFNLEYLYNQAKEYEKCMNFWQEGHKKGKFFGLDIEKYYFKEHLKAYTDLEGFKDIVERDNEIIGLAQEKAKAEFEISLPNNFDKNREYPLFIALHGGGGTKEETKHFWQSESLNKKYIVAHIQSSQIFTMNGFSWNFDTKRGRKDIEKCFGKIMKEYGKNIDDEKVYIGGFSAGAAMSIDMILQDLIDIRGFIAFAPQKPASFNDDNVKKAASKNIKGVILTGEKEFSIEQQKEMVEAFDKENLECSFMIEDIGHFYPDNFSDYLEKAVKFIEK